MHFAKLLCPVLLALPLAAHAAEPVRFTTRMSGQMSPHPVIFQQLGLGDYWHYSGGPLPFSLTVDSIVDQDELDYWCEGNYCYLPSASISYTFTVDGKSAGFADRDGSAEIAWSSNSFRNGINFRTVDYPATDGYYVSIDTWLQAPEGSFGADPFAPRLLGGPGLTGHVNISMLPLDPENPGYWSDIALADSTTFQVSAVPEPARAGMLAAGLAALAVAGRRRYLPSLLAVRVK